MATRIDESRLHFQRLKSCESFLVRMRLLMRRRLFELLPQLGRGAGGSTVGEVEDCRQFVSVMLGQCTLSTRRMP